MTLHRPLRKGIVETGFRASHAGYRLVRGEGVDGGWPVTIGPSSHSPTLVTTCGRSHDSRRMEDQHLEERSRPLPGRLALSVFPSPQTGGDTRAARRSDW